MFNCPCVILAGGKSSRMGKDKSKLPFKGFGSLCEYQVSRLKPFFKSLHVSTKEDKFDFDVSLIFDEGEEYSPMVALKKILTHFTNTPVFILSVDAPFVKQEQIKQMYDFTNAHEIVIPETKEHTHQLCGFYHTNIANKIDELLANNEHKIKLLLKKSDVKFVFFEDEASFANLNYPKEYEKYNKGNL